MAEMTDELLERVLQSAASLSRRQATHLIDEVRQQVESEVRDLLHSAWKAALLRELVDALEQPQHAPPSDATAGPIPSASRPTASAPPQPMTSADHRPEDRPEEAWGIYAYGIVASDHPSLTHELAAVDSAFPIQLLRRGDLQVITSRVSLRDFSPDDWGERLTDLDWVEARARAHDQVLKAALALGPLIPLRFGTVFYSEADLVRLLSEDHDRLQEMLHRLDGKAEWGVKIKRPSHSNGNSNTSRAESRSAEAPHNGSGRAYLLEKQRRGQARSEARDEAETIARQCYSILSAAACEAVALPVHHRGRQTDEQELILNSSYLLDHSQVDPFRSLVETLAERYRPSGLTFEMTGPWPPYDFVNLELSLEDSDESIAVGR